MTIFFGKLDRYGNEYESINIGIFLRCPKFYYKNEKGESFTSLDILKKTLIQQEVSIDQIEKPHKNIVYLSGEIGLEGSGISILEHEIGPFRVNTQNNSLLEFEIEQNIQKIISFINSKNNEVIKLIIYYFG